MGDCYKCICIIGVCTDACSALYVNSLNIIPRILHERTGSKRVETNKKLRTSVKIVNYTLRKAHDSHRHCVSSCPLPVLTRFCLPRGKKGEGDAAEQNSAIK